MKYRLVSVTRRTDHKGTKTPYVIDIIEDIDISRVLDIIFDRMAIRKVFSLSFLLLLLLLFVFPKPLHAAYTGPVPEALLKLSSGFAVFVDKKQQKLYVFQRVGSGLEKVFESPCSTGKVLGAKAVEGDAKTPNGIFFATRFATMPDTNSTYGSMVFYLDYPNLFDKRAGRNGDNIWIHGTNKSLQPNQSNGCVAMRNQDIENLSRFIFLGKTPIVIEESIRWVDQRDRRPEADELERIARLWTRSMIDSDWKTFENLYLQEGIEPSSQRKALFQRASHLKTASWHFDIMPRDVTICRIGFTAVVLFDQVLSLRGSDNVQRGYLKLYLEKYSTGWFIVDSIRPATTVAKREPVVQARPAEIIRKPEPVLRDNTPKRGGSGGWRSRGRPTGRTMGVKLGKGPDGPIRRLLCIQLPGSGKKSEGLGRLQTGYRQTVQKHPGSRRQHPDDGKRRQGNGNLHAELQRFEHEEFRAQEA